MKKLALDLDSLRVETFDPSAADGHGEGTVFAHVSREYDGCLYTNEPCPAHSMSEQVWSACGTCEITDGDTCDNHTCINTCVDTCAYPCTGMTACYYTCCSDPC